MGNNAHQIRSEAVAKSPLVVLAALSPRLQAAALTVMFKQNNAPFCKGILLKKLQGWETSLKEYSAKAPAVLGDTITELNLQAKAARFALVLPSKEAVAPPIAYVSAEHLRTMLEVAVCQRAQEWVPAALSSAEPRNGGSVSSWLKRA